MIAPSSGDLGALEPAMSVRTQPGQQAFNKICNVSAMKAGRHVIKSPNDSFEDGLLNLNVVLIRLKNLTYEDMKMIVDLNGPNVILDFGLCRSISSFARSIFICDMIHVCIYPVTFSLLGQTARQDHG